MAESLYETDFYGWTQQQVQLIRSGNLEALDLNNILEELDNMGKSEYRQFSHRLDILLMHLLKWQFQPEHRSSGWKGSIEEQRFRLTKLLKENPSMKSKVPSMMADAYEVARINAYKETGLAKTAFPGIPPWTIEQAMDSQFWPD
ncbi:DUF29 domain-containing protein [Endozoicomonas sp. Mp262]|uniref:DUF29 domain-containing protein n=1 Tax=Endozoicomonas sp. Mp262 TaxID=2919499 RepID=UPI0021D7E524